VLVSLSFEKLATHTTLRWMGYEAEDPTGGGYHSSPLQIEEIGFNLQELTKIGQLKTGKMGTE